MQSLKKKTDGFTIIEVMIVLVIAAVIILIVFLAVPALQRNSRNNQRRNDASRVLTAANEYRSNNQNQPPTINTQVTNIAGSLSFYDSGQVAIGPLTNAVQNMSITAPGGFIIAQNISILTNATCNNGTSVSFGGSIVAVFYLETGGGNVQGQCI